MRHNKKFNHLGRQTAHRASLLANMTVSLIFHKRINTTLAKAKALRVYAEPLINRAKEDTTANRRLVFAHLQNKEAIKILFQDIAEKIANRPGGYTRILKTGNRLGDNAKTCFIELVDYNEAMLGGKEEAKTKTTRRSRRKGAKSAEAAAENPVAEVKEEPKELPEA
ncbi:MAG: 50S ribosomal protein L17 [Muribaculaceae bacterium]|nr:50S ribosomal protein L17 [Muribaculaceae bacterium]